ncbi:MAG: hypothetical protein OSB57_02865 [Planctomycetota bacterium]|nr:hypothetical protein [Planctomycetota bacterium]
MSIRLAASAAQLLAVLTDPRGARCGPIGISDSVLGSEFKLEVSVLDMG